MYTLRGVGKRYGRCSVLRDITCAIPTDQVVVITGSSGAGKSTLLRLLTFIEMPDLGDLQLHLNGTLFDSATPERPWPRVTCVFQRQFLWPHLTLIDNLRLPLRAASRSDSEKRIREAVELFGMESFIRRYPNEVSGGQAQRVALARALVLDPELVLIDEPHSGLDLEQQSVVNEHLSKLRARGVGLVIVTHSLNFLRVYANTVVTMEDGTVSGVTSQEVFIDRHSKFLRARQEE